MGKKIMGKRGRTTGPVGRLGAGSATGGAGVEAPLAAAGDWQTKRKIRPEIEEKECRNQGQR